jgi:propanediol dehydratase small subunit
MNRRNDKKLGVADYPIAEKHADAVRGRRGRALADITLDAVLSGDVTMDDLSISPDALRQQGDIARDANRPTLGANFERAAELALVPQDMIMTTYELLRPGRAASASDLRALADVYRLEHRAPNIAAFLEEAAETYEKRGLFTKRF